MKLTHPCPKCHKPAKIQAELLRTSSTVIRDAVKGGKLKVEAGVYDLATGKVTLS